MKSSISQDVLPRLPVRKIAMLLAVASLLGGAMTAPAYADDDHRGHYDQRDHRDRHDDRHDDRRDDRRGYRHDDRHDYGHPYVYAQPVYVPPTVYVEPQQSPGISLFLPIYFRH
jgi:hypothetical protein